jgi:PKD repeat protein
LKRLLFLLYFILFQNFASGQIQIYSNGAANNVSGDTTICGPNTSTENYYCSSNPPALASATWSLSANAAPHISIGGASNASSVTLNFSPNSTPKGPVYLRVISATGNFKDSIALYVAPILNWNTFTNPFCGNASPSLSSLVNAPGGLFNTTPTNIVSGGQLNTGLLPALPASLSLNYSYTTGNYSTCTNLTLSTPIQILDYPTNPTLTLPFTQKCRSDQPFALSGGSPLGGTYSATSTPSGVQLGVMYPGQFTPGSHAIQYTVTNGSGCSSATSSNFSIVEYPIDSIQVTDITDPANPVFISPVQYFGVTTYSICNSISSGTGAVFNLKIGTTQFPVGSSYTIDWGNSTNTSGTISQPLTSLSKNYLNPGLYYIQLVITSPNGCKTYRNLNLYFGAIPPITLGAPGNTKACLLRGLDSVSFDFEIGQWQTDPVGIQYIITVDDGSDTLRVSAPLAQSGTTAHPKLVYLNTPSGFKLFYRHWFTKSSCGSTSNTKRFTVKVRKTEPCPGSYAEAQVTPIIISESPVAGIEVPDSACTNTDVVVRDASTAASYVLVPTGSSGTYECDTTYVGVWKIIPNPGLPQPTLVSGTLGSRPSNPAQKNNPVFWGNGTHNIKLKFSKPGNYTIRRYIGIRNFKGTNFALSVTTCGIDSISETICIDTIPKFLGSTPPLPAQVCVGTTLTKQITPETIRCNAPLTYVFQLTDRVTGSTVKYVSFTDTVNDASPVSLSILADVPGYFRYRLAVSNFCGSDEDTGSIRVLAVPLYTFPQAQATYCLPTSGGTYIDFASGIHNRNGNATLSLPTSISYSIVPTAGWTLNSVTNGIPAVTFNQAGTYQVVFTYANSCGSDTARQLINISPPPVANFTTVLDGCGPLNYVLSNTSSATPGKTLSSYRWWITPVPPAGGGFLGNDTSFLQNPSLLLPKSLLDSANYTLFLAVTDNLGCTATKQMGVTVFPTPTAKFSLPNAPLCPPAVLSAADSSMSGYPLSKSQFLSRTWKLFSNFTLIQVAQNPTTPSWNLGNTTNLPITYTIRLVVTNIHGCKDSVNHSIVVSPLPQLSIQVLGGKCLPTSLQISATFQSGTGSLEWSWAPGANAVSGFVTTGLSSLTNPSTTLTPGNTTATDSIPITIRLRLLDANGCIQWKYKTLYLYPQPTASFTTPPTGCTPYTLQTTNNSVPNIGTGIGSNNWRITRLGSSWSRISNASAPAWTLTNQGVLDSTYIARLIVTNQKGCSDTLTHSFVVHPKAKAKIVLNGPAASCPPFAINSSVLSADLFPQANSGYSWQVFALGGNSLFGPSSALNYTITTPNTAVWVVLTATSLHSCANDVDSIRLETIPNPQPSFTVSPTLGCSPVTPVISNTTVNASLLQHSWKIYSPLGQVVQTSSSSTPTFTPVVNLIPSGAPAQFTVRLFVTASSGCVDSTKQTFKVRGEPQALFSINSPNCPGVQLQVTNNSLGNGLTYSWKVFKVHGTQLLPQNWVNTGSVSNPIYKLPRFQVPNPDSTYQLRLIVTADTFCVDSITLPFVVKAQPRAQFSAPSPLCSGLTSLAANTSAAAAARPLTYLWSSSNGATFSSTTAQNPTITFPAVALDSVLYNVQLIVNDAGCTDTTFGTVKVYAEPTAVFSGVTSGCTPWAVAPLSTATSNIGNRPNLQYQWRLIKGSNLLNTSTLQNPTWSLVNTTTAPENYTLKLLVTNDFGCKDSASYNFQVFPNAKATTVLNGAAARCAPFVINNSVLTASAFPQANASVSWTVKSATGTVLAGPSPSLNYTINTPNTSVWVILTANSLHNCNNDKDSLLLQTIPNPNAAFTISPNDTLCHGKTTLLSSIVFNSNWSYTWRQKNPSQPAYTTFGTNTNSQTWNFTNNSLIPLTYLIKLTAYNNVSGCADSALQNILVLPNPIPTIQASVTCFKDSVTLTADSPLANTVSAWNWEIDNILYSTKIVKHKFNLPGQYTVKLRATYSTGCDTSISQIITVFDYPIANYSINSSCGTDTVCVNSPFSITNLTNTTQFSGTVNSTQWDMDEDGFNEYTTTNPIHTYTTSGLKTIRLIATTINGCPDTLFKTLFVDRIPETTIKFNGDTVCGPHSPTFSITDSGTIKQISTEIFAYNNANQKVTVYSSSGPLNPPSLVPNILGDTLYVVSRKVSNCCGLRESLDSLIVRGKPVANFAVLPDSGCTPLNVLFQLDGLIKGPSDSARLVFGDGQSSVFSPIKILQGNKYIYQWGPKNHLYQYGGFNDTTYLATLTVYNDCGDSSISKPIYLQANTVQAFFTTNKSQGCAPLIVNFTNQSFNYTTNAWCFSFSNNNCTGGSSVATNPQWTFTVPGTYTVALFVNNGCGYDTAYKVITVFPSPNIAASSNAPKCIGEPIQFQSTASMSGGGLLAYTWNFGDGTSSILSSPSHTFLTAGNKLVRVYVQSQNGCIDSTSLVAPVSPIPAVGFSFSTNCFNNQPIVFTNTSTISSGSIATFSWDFGDGNTSNLQSPTHSYSTPGAYQVRLIAMSAVGCIDSLKQTLILHPIPAAAISPKLISGDSCSIPQTYQFTNNTVGAIGHYWDFNYSGPRGVNTSLLTSPVFTFSNAGIYTVAYFAQNSFGCGDTSFLTIVVRDGVIAQFNYSPLAGCSPLTIQANFNALITPGIDTLDYFLFYPGDGSVVSTTNLNNNYVYSVPGKFTPSLVAFTVGGCKDSIYSTDTITVYPSPSGDFDIVKINWRKIQLINRTQPPTGNTYSWNFGDGNTSNDISPTHEYSANVVGIDTINVCLAIENGYGCRDTICKPLWLWKAQLSVPNAFTPNLDYVEDDNVFAPKGHSLGTYKLSIYNKWGNLVYYTDKVDSDGIPIEPWNGRFMNTGDPLPMGAYVWKIYAVFNDGTRWLGEEDAYEIIRDFGTVTLLR